MNFQDIQQFIAHYGYYAMLASAVIEGETILMLGAIAASKGLLDLRLVILCAAISAIVADNSFFWLGRFQGRLLLRLFPTLEARLQRFNALLERWHTALIMLLRFLYGLRTVGPMAVGMSGMSPLRFLLADLFSAVLWACVFGCLGFFLGQQLLPVLSRPGALKAALLPVFGVLVLAGGVVFWWRRRAALRP